MVALLVFIIATLEIVFGGQQEYNTISWRDTTHFDSEDDYCTGCRNVSHCQQQQSFLFRTTFTGTIKPNLLLKWLLGSNLSQKKLLDERGPFGDNVIKNPARYILRKFSYCYERFVPNCFSAWVYFSRIRVSPKGLILLLLAFRTYKANISGSLYIIWILTVW